jgi:hypothetical protein
LGSGGISGLLPLVRVRRRHVLPKPNDVVARSAASHRPACVKTNWPGKSSTKTRFPKGWCPSLDQRPRVACPQAGPKRRRLPASRQFLNRILVRLCPGYRERLDNVDVYWTAFQTEWATDICFDDILRFMNKRRSFQGDVAKATWPRRRGQGDVAKATWPRRRGQQFPAIPGRRPCEASPRRQHGQGVRQGRIGAAHRNDDQPAEAISRVSRQAG